MAKIKFTGCSVIINLSILVFSVFMVAGCSFQLPKIITGEAVDESGQTLQNVAIRACYLGWGWNDYLVWDKSYCSDPVFTNNHGQYAINFNGFLLPWSPASSSLTLWAQKEGWTQSDSVYLPNTRIIMASNERMRARRTAELRLSQSHFQQRLTGESDAAYYCRVVLPQARAISMRYHGESLSVTPLFLQPRDGEQAIFAVRGSVKAVNTFFDEAVLKLNRQTLPVNFKLMAATKSCPADIDLMSVRLPERQLAEGSEVELVVPSISAMFDAKIWRL